MRAWLDFGTVSFLWHSSDRRLSDHLRSVSPGTIGIALVHLPPDRAGELFSALPAALQIQAAQAILGKGGFSRVDVARAAEELLPLGHGVEAMEAVRDRRFDMLAAILGAASHSARDVVFGALQTEAHPVFPLLRDAVVECRGARGHFAFEDIARLRVESLRAIVAQVSPGVLALALRGTSREVRGPVFAALPMERRALVEREYRALRYLRMSEVARAQREVLDALSRLNEDGRISVDGQGRDSDSIRRLVGS